MAFSSGAVGGLVNSIVVWLFGILGITALLGVALAPNWTPAWLYPRIVWGGLFGLLVPFAVNPRNNPLLSGLLLSLAPTLVQLFIVFPAKTPHGVLGLGLGALTPLFVLLFNAVWGLITVALYRLLTNSSR
ncbi:MAG TPA: hypothetical protein V6D29_17195 [Leptolyngbyaceae cyanobacterium]